MIVGLSKSRQIGTQTDTNTMNKSLELQNLNGVSIKTEEQVFCYDFMNNEHVNSENTTYSNISCPSSKDNAKSVPIIVVPPPPPPLVFRDLKPGRKTSDSNINNELSPIINHKDINSANKKHIEPPRINRKLKPAAKLPTEGNQFS